MPGKSALCEDGLDDQRALAAIGSAPIQDYADFRKMLNLPPTDGVATLIPISAVDSEAAAKGAMCLAAKKDAEKRKQRAEERAAAAAAARATLASLTPPRQAAVDQDGIDELELEGLDEMELDAGGTRDVTKSPQHHKLQMDNFVPEEAEDADEGAGECEAGSPTSSGGDSEWVDVAKERAAEAVEVAGAVTTAAGADAPPSLAPTARIASSAAPTGGAEAWAVGSENAAAAEAVEPFSLDPSFDYENIKLTSERFSMALALSRGEFYDRDAPEASAPAPAESEETLEAEEEAPLPLPVD